MAEQVEKLSIEVLTGGLAPRWASGESTGWTVQPDVLMKADNCLVFVEAKRIIGGTFQARQIARSLQATLDACGRVVIIDLHSFPSVTLPYELHGDADRPKVCRGADNFLTGKNTKMRKAMELQLPLIWFRQQDSGRYVPYKVFIINDFPVEGYCFIAPDLSLATAARSESLIERRYAERTMKQRLHQPAFRAQVISAYETKCAICRLGHGRLLDAAHITPDNDETSSTSVTNGLSLCKIHHTAYDINIVGIDANYTVHIRADILAEKDGPMLQHGIKEMDNSTLWVPPVRGARPDPERLDARFREFASQGL